MKNNIYITGLICLAITLVASIFKIMHWPGAGILLIAGIGSLTIFYLPIAYVKLKKNTGDKLLKFLYSAALFSFVVDFIGMVFKIMHWPGAGLIMIVGIPLPFILFLPVYVIYHNKRKLKTDLNFFAVLMFMVYLGVFSVLLAINPNTGNYMVYAHSTNNVSQSNTYLSQLKTDKSDSEIKQTAKQLVIQIEEIKLNLIRAINPENKTAINQDSSINYFEVENKNMVVLPEIIYNSGLDKFNKSFDQFEKMMKANNSDENTARLINEIDEYRLSKNADENALIVQLPLITVLNVLSDWQNKLLLIYYVSN
jgi:hypothetical protein